jgi:protein-tyrosine-phosphatase
MAEGIFRDLVKKIGLEEQFFIDSCGTSGQHVGEMADYRGRKVLLKHGIDYQHHARKLSPKDLDYFDLILAMDSQNLFEIQRLAKPHQKEKVKLMMEFSDLFPAERNVHDPYHEGEDKFEEVFLLLSQCSSVLLQRIIER